VFEQAGYTPLTRLADDPETVAEARRTRRCSRTRRRSGRDHFDVVVRKLKKRPAIIAHSFGGLLAQISPGAARVGDGGDRSAPFRGVLRCRSPR